MPTFRLHLDFITIQTAEVFHGVLVAVTLFNKWRAMSSMLKLNVDAYFLL